MMTRLRTLVANLYFRFDDEVICMCNWGIGNYRGYRLMNWAAWRMG